MRPEPTPFEEPFEPEIQSVLAAWDGLAWRHHGAGLLQAYLPAGPDEMVTCGGMYVSVNVDGHDEEHLQVLVPSLKHLAEPVSVDELRALCADYRGRGFVVFPKDGCDNYDEGGY